MNLALLLLAAGATAAAGAEGAGAFQIIYLLCALVGLLFTVVSFLMSGVFEAGDVGDHDFDAGHGDFDAGGDLDAGHDVGHAGGDSAFDTHSGETVALGPISPTTIAMFITTFGAVGYLSLVYLEMTDWYLHLPLATASGFAMAALIFWVLYQVFQVTVSSSEVTVASLPGTHGEVIVAIPQDGLGEIAYTARGSRYNAPARSTDGKPVKQFSSVVIQKVVGGTCVVALEADSGDSGEAGT